ncbi:hypothetical protein N7452_009711 [Penicillium brevicompactum]|uniref:Uncharacterized protein n=1 Tax=Penicillium brevicompactum TaxID=5074 RepID=A0A9W9Q8X7_PENBR|nr:hypothetical protein N7452_009711 [Penicillium brevicompactum]
MARTSVSRFVKPNTKGSKRRRRDAPAYEEEISDADNELSDDEFEGDAMYGPYSTPDAFDDFSSVLNALPEPQPLFHFHICRDSHPLHGTKGKSDGWANASYLLWEMCAILAAAGTDYEWTVKFEKHLPTWQKIQQQVKTYGFTHFSSEIPAAPVDLAFVRLPKEDRSFEIEQDPHGDVQDSSDVWALWRYIIEMPVAEEKLFEVRLVDPDVSVN